MLYIKCEDITKAKVEAIVNAANGCGIMGAGLAGALKKTAGIEIENEAKEKVKTTGKPFSEGSIYTTISGQLQKNGVQHIIHAVTMKFPGQLSSLHTINQLVETICKFAVDNKIKSIAIPGLGTGIGGLDKESVANILLNVCTKYSHLLDIYIMDRDSKLIDLINEKVETE